MRRVEGGGQPVLSFEQCFIYLFLVFLCVRCWGPRFCSSPAGGMLFGVSGLLLVLLLLCALAENI